jgi:hypothetical protein
MSRNQGSITSRNRRMFLFSTASRLILGTTQLPVQWVPSVKEPGRETDHLNSSRVEVRYTCDYTFTPPYVFMV